MYPFLKKLFADGGYQGPEFQKALAKILPYIETEIVKRSDHAKGFVVLPRRWIVERTIAWLNRCRRLAKDWENLNRKALAFLRLASVASCSENSVIPFDVPGQTLTLQLPFCFEVRALGGSLVSSAPAGPCDDVCGLNTVPSESYGNAADFLD